MTRTRFRLNPNMAAEVATLPGNARVKRDNAKAIVAAAKERAPKNSGAYERSIRWVEKGDVTAVATTDFAGHIIEFGSIKSPTYAPLRNGAMSTGMRYVAASRT